MAPTVPEALPAPDVHEELACCALRGGVPVWPFGDNAELGSRFRHYTYRHGVQPLLHAQLRSSPVWADWPPTVRQALTNEAACQAVLEIVQRQEAVRALAALNQAARRRPLLLKGAALAHTHYACPHLRPCGDTDVLIDWDDRDPASKILEGLGYEPRLATSGNLVSFQRSWDKRDRHGFTHTIDLHWRINNCQTFAQAISHDDLESSSVSVPVLGARALGPVHALMLACMHRVGHITAPCHIDDVLHYGDRLIWLFDVHLLIQQMSAQELVQFAQFAIEKRLRTVCLDALRQSQRRFATPLSDEVVRMLSAAGPPEPSALYLRPGRLRYLLADIRSLSNWPDRLRLAAEHLFPPREYVLQKYAVSRRAWLPALYVRRGMQGIWKLLREG